MGKDAHAVQPSPHRKTGRIQFRLACNHRKTRTHTCARNPQQDSP